MNKYNIWYNSLMQNAKVRNWTKTNAPCYVESHHIIPKSLGGGNDKDNLVLLTAREHAIAHLMLSRFGDSTQRSKMIWALQRFLTSNKTISSVLYAKTRELWVEEHKRRMIGNTHTKGRKDTLETRLKKSKSMTGVVGKWIREDKHCEEISKRTAERNKTNNPMASEENRKKVAMSKLGRKRIYREDGSFYMSKVV